MALENELAAVARPGTAFTACEPDYKKPLQHNGSWNWNWARSSTETHARAEAERSRAWNGRLLFLVGHRLVLQILPLGALVDACLL